jgi:hypothetical protein
VIAGALAVAACDARQGAWEQRSDEPPRFTSGYLGAWPPARVTARFGRGVAPGAGARLPLASGIARARVIPVEGDGPPLAVIEGGGAIELVEVDSGALRWRDDTRCTGSVRAADRAGVVCAADGGTASLGLDGGAWTDPRALVFADATAVYVSDGATLVPLDRATGGAGTPIALPAGVLPSEIVARCGDDLFAANATGLRVVRAGKVAWTAAIGATSRVGACDDVVLAEVAPPAPRATGPAVAAAATPAPPPRSSRRKRRGRRAPPPPASSDERPPPSGPNAPMPAAVSLVDRGAAVALVAIDRATGRVLARGVLARGWWPARVPTVDAPSAIELATAAGLEVRTRSLAAARTLPASPVVGALLDRRGALRLVAGPPVGGGEPRTLYVLDERGVRAVFTAPAASAALGDGVVIAAGSDGPAVRLALPRARPTALPVSPTAPPLPPIDGAALPAVNRAPPSPISGGSHGGGAVVAVAIDPVDAAIVWAAGEQATLVRLDLRARALAEVKDACPTGAVVALAVTSAVVVCAANNGGVGHVTATHRAGAQAWSFTTSTIDAVSAAGDAVVVLGRDRAQVLAASTGVLLDDRRDDAGLPARVVPVALGDASGFLAIEREAITLRLLGAPLAAPWSAAPAGQASLVGTTTEAALVLVDGWDPYRLDLATGRATSLAAAAERWTVAGDLFLGEHADRAPGAAPGWAIRAFDADGERFRLSVDLRGTARLAARGPAPDAPIVLVDTYPPVDDARLFVIDPASGAVRRVIEAGTPASSAGLFATVVDDQPVVGAVDFGLGGAFTF